jgi:hypothetical protein
MMVENVNFLKTRKRTLIIIYKTLKMKPWYEMQELRHSQKKISMIFLEKRSAKTKE